MSATTAKILCGAAAVLGMGGSAAFGAVYADPIGGWNYAYEGSSAGSDADFALDGSWNHTNGSDEWDGSGRGAGAPGGAEIHDEAGTGFLRLQETGDPRDHGIPDPSNRKIYFTRSLSGIFGGDPLAGATLHFRTRLSTGLGLSDVHPDGGGAISPWPAAGAGYTLHDGGKGNFGVRGAAGIFSVAINVDGLVTPNGTIPLGAPAEWNEVWITLREDGGQFLADIYLNGSLVPITETFAPGTGSDGDAPYLALGVGATPQFGAIDVDFFRVAAGAAAPVPEPSALMLALFGLGCASFWRRRV